MKKHWLWIVTILWICFIFGNSLMNAELSGNTSGNLSRILFDLLMKAGITITFDAFHHFIRKLAHFTEYFILAVLVCLSLKYQPLRITEKPVFCVSWSSPHARTNSFSILYRDATVHFPIVFWICPVSVPVHSYSFVFTVLAESCFPDEHTSFRDIQAKRQTCLFFHGFA